MKRFEIIRELKTLVPGYKSTRTDKKEMLENKLNEIYQSMRKPLPFLEQIQGNTLVDFLENPRDNATITVSPFSLTENIHHRNNTNEFVLQMTSVKNTTHFNRRGFQTHISVNEENRFLGSLEDAESIRNDLIESNITSGEVNYGSDVDTFISSIKKNRGLVKLTWIEKSNYRKTNSGAYFKYFNKSRFDLTRYQIFNQNYDSTKEDKVNCLIYALSQCPHIRTNDIENLKISLFHKEVKLTDLKKISLNLGIQFKIRYDSKQSEIIYGKQFENSISLGLVDNHWFINEPTNITKFAIESYDSICNGSASTFILKQMTKFPTIHPNRNFNQKCLSSFNAINLIFCKYQHLFEPITLANLRNKESTDAVSDYNELREPNLNEVRSYQSNSEKEFFKGYFKKNNPNDNFDIWFFDTESCIINDKHVPYLLVAERYYGRYNGSNLKMNLEFASRKIFNGLDCARQFFNQLTRNVILYAHNAAFDFSMIVNELFDLRDVIQTGTFLKSAQGKAYNSKGWANHVLIKDSYSFLTAPLSKIPKMLGLESGDKDVFPHSLINVDNFKSIVPLSDCLNHLKPDQHEDFISNAKKQDCLVDAYVDLKKYSEAYCIQDVRILSQGFIKFRQQIKEVTNFDIIELLSTPQLADCYFKSVGVYDGCYSISGIANDFIRRCCVGGRVMCRDNQKINVTTSELITNVPKGHHGCQNLTQLTDFNSGAIADFDAVSLYPSAMFRLEGIPMGLPKVIDNNTDLSACDAYYCEIEVISCDRWRGMPLQSIKVDGIRNFTNDIVGKRLYLDNIALDDLIKYQDIKYRLIRGYYYDSGLNNKLSETINYMFNKRLELKNQGNKLESIYKLLMNSSYGKLIQKPINTMIKFIEDNKINKYVIKNHKFVKSWAKVNDKTYVVREAKSINEHFSCPHIASLILSMSKRIMNEVICTAEDLNINVYYQDTDSMHIHENAISILASEFERKYKRKLIGKKMGQFHSDFAVSDPAAKNIRSIQAIFLGKKCYMDVLQYENTNNETKNDVHVRMKGIPSKAIIENDDPIDTYNKLFDHQSIKFDLKKFIPLQKDSDYAYRANTRCIARTLKF